MCQHENRVPLLKDVQLLSEERVVGSDDGHLLRRAPNNMPSLCPFTVGSE
jgi:hypothetical protein